MEEILGGNTFKTLIDTNITFQLDLHVQQGEDLTQSLNTK